MFGCDERIRRKVMKRREDDNQIRGQAADGGKGMSGNRARVDMPCVRRDDSDNVSVNFGKLSGVEIGIHTGGKGFRVAVVPRA